MNGLDEDSGNELVRLADLARRGDTAGIVDWSLETAKSVSGKDIAELIAERQGKQQETTKSVLDEQPKGLTEDEVRAITRSENEAFQRQEQGRQAVARDLKALGYGVDDADGMTIINYAVNSKTDLETAAKWYENDVLAKMSARQKAAAGAAATVPQGAPNGAPAGKVPDDRPMREKALERLKAGQTNTSRS